MKQWNRGQDRVSDQKAPNGTDKASYHVREPIEGDDERLAMRQGDMPPNELPLREFGKTEQYRTSDSSEKMHRATSKDAYTKAGSDSCRSVSSQSVRKAGPNVDFYNVSTCQCSILFNHTGSSNKE